MITQSSMRVFSVILAFVWIALWTTILKGDEGAAILFFDMSSTAFKYPFTIQNFMWVMFFIGLGELYFRYQESREDIRDLTSNYLIEDEGVFYNTEDLVSVMTKVQGKGSRIAHLIQSLFMRYQASQKSPDETHKMLNSQLEMMQYKLDVDYNMIRYLAWLIPTLGFIGTVVGISKALSYAGIPGKAEEATFLTELTTRLAVAFDTTLVALMMSAILVYIMHLMQGREEHIVQRCGEYCLNNFINRLISK